MTQQTLVNRFVISTFVMLYLIVSIISTIHVIDFFSMSNPYWLAVSLAIAFEVGAAASLASLIALDKMNKSLVWALFITITLMQMQGNMYYAFKNLNGYDSWVQLFNLVEEDPLYQKRILSFVSGAILPLVALGFIKSLVDYIKPEKEHNAPIEEQVESMRKVKLNKEISKYIAEKSDPEIIKPRGGEFVQPVGQGFSVGKVSNQADQIDLAEDFLEILGEDYFTDLGLKKSEISGFIFHVMNGLDLKNAYKYGYLKGSDIAQFRKQAEIKINDFRKFPEYFEKLSSDKDKKIAMFCTGGIRCEKAASYLFKRGFKNVYQLKGGILNYLNKIPSKKSLWNGECFVFDERITVVNNSKIGNYLMCAGCRTPISKKDIQSPKYEKDVSCPKCFDKLTEKQKYRFRMRASQKLNGKLKTNLLQRASV